MPPYASLPLMPPYCHVTDASLPPLDPTWMTPHTPPASRATAHGVDGAWNNHNEPGMTYHPPQPHEQLLMGWIAGMMTTMVE